MSWNPKEAKEVLDRSHKVIFVRSVKKIAGYKFKSGRELVLSIENLTQVTLYVSRIPYNMIDVEFITKYMPTTLRSGRNADINAVCPSLGYDQKAYSIKINNEIALKCFLDWYQYA